MFFKRVRFQHHIQLHIFRNYRIWLNIFVAAFLIATAVSAWPSVQCALGQCDARAMYCTSDCSQTCQASTKEGYVDACTPFDADKDGEDDYCDDTWLPNKCAVRCTSDSNCTVTTIQSGGECKGRLSTSGGHSYWRTDKCPSIKTDPTCGVAYRITKVTCCVGSTVPTPGPGPGPGPCTPSYDAPTVTLAGVTPPFPIVFGQDPDELGFDATVIAVGGSENSGCDNGPAQQALSSLNLDFLALSDESVNWIEYDLAQFYPGARVKDYYPYHPNFQVIINGVNGSLVFHHDPLDPGLYDIHVTAVQDDGQQTTVVFHIPAYLLEATIIHP